MVARLSGVPASTIRMWERRYQAVQPSRTAAGGRLYTQADTARLALLKELVARGNAISTIAGLDDGSLRERLSESVARPSAPVGRCRLALLGESLASRLQPALAALPQIEWLGVHASAEALADLVAPGVADVVIVDTPTLRAHRIPDLLALLQAQQPRLLVVVYSFAAERDLLNLDLDRILLMRAPVDPLQLLRVCLLSLNLAPRGERQATFEQLMHQPAPPPRFNESQLATFAREPNSIRCECPRHLSDLLSSLATFERYSNECASSDAEDAALHLMLQRITGHARGLLEEALERIDAAAAA